MKRKLLQYSLWMLLLLLWVLFGAVFVYLDDYNMLKVTFFLSLLGISFIIFMLAGTPWKTQSQQRLKLHSFFAIKVVLIFFIFCLGHYLNQQQKSRFDLTHQRIYQVNLALKEELLRLGKEGEIKFTFLGSKVHWQVAEELFARYQQITNIQLDWLDPDRHPEKIKKFSKQQLPALLIETARGQQWVNAIDDWNIGLALTSLRKGKVSMLCFLEGHGELNLASEDADGLSGLKEILHTEAYKVRHVKLTDNNSLSDYGCRALLILGAKDDFLEIELNKLDEIVKKTPILVALDPWKEKNYLPKFRQWLSAYGVDSKGTPLLDQSAVQLGEEAINILWEPTAEEKKEVTQINAISGRTLWQMTTAFEDNQDVSSLISSQSFPTVWQEANWDELQRGKVGFQENVDSPGPKTMAVLSQKNGAKTLLVLGTSRLWMNGSRPYPSNFQLALALTHLMLQEENIAPHSQALVQEKLWLHHSQVNLILYLSVMVMPLILLLVAFLFYKQSKSRNT